MPGEPNIGMHKDARKLAPVILAAGWIRRNEHIDTTILRG